VYSHGLNRFPRFLSMIRRGLIDIHAQPVLVSSAGALERWDGKSGPGNLNAHQSMDRAITLAREHGVGCVGLANTNHWMRGGSYGWQAADAGVLAICWTNTLPNLPPWGVSDPRLGNNPLVIAVPRNQGHVVLDMAMSQFSYGALASYRMRGEPLPVDGGYDSGGQLTRDAGAIEASNRPLPIGFWKGSGLALMLDLFAALLSGGKATHQITPDPDRETMLSQVFIAFDPSSMTHPDEDVAPHSLTDQVIAYLQGMSGSNDPGVRYPGERVLQTRKENLEKGVPVDAAIWQQLQSM
jgi:3-dehydro-L-gulonate 2-dehydrogenase